MVGGICDVLDQLNDLPLKISKKMWRRNKQRKSCMQMQHRSEFFGLCFFFFFFFSYSFMDHRLDTKRKRFRTCSACQSSFYFGPASCSFSAVSAPPAARAAAAPRVRLAWLIELLSQRNIPMKSAKNAMRLM